MQLETTAVSTKSAQKSGVISGNVDFFLYLLKTGTLSAELSRQQRIPFLKSDGSKENTIWFSRKLQDQWSLKTFEGLTEFCAELSSDPRSYDICIIDDGIKTSWCLYNKGENGSTKVATVTVTDTTNATPVAKVK